MSLGAGSTEVNFKCSRRYLGQISRAAKGRNALSEHCDEDKLALGEPEVGRGGSPTQTPPTAAGSFLWSPTATLCPVSEIQPQSKVPCRQGGVC